MCCWIGMNSCLNEVVVELDMLLLLICTMGIPFCEVVVWIGEVCVEFHVKDQNEFLMYKVVDWVFGVVGWVRLSIISVFMLWLC